MLGSMQESQPNKGIFVEHFSKLKDHRITRHKLHPLIEIIFLAVCGSICGAESWRDFVMFGKTKIDYLRKYFPFKNGIPSKSTIALVFSKLNPKKFKECFIGWVRAIQSVMKDIISIDGKMLRHSFNNGSNQSAIHMVSAFSDSMNLVLAQEKVGDKTNEITAIPKLLEILELTGSIVTIDAMGCQTKIAKQIIDQGGDYVLGLKGNQTSLHEDVKLYFEAELSKKDSKIIEMHEDVCGEHGRVETRKCFTINHVDWLPQFKKWSGLKTLVMIESTRENKADLAKKDANITQASNPQIDAQVKSTKERRFYISSLAEGAEKHARVIRSHWNIENKVHYVLDVTFNEDASRIRKDHAPENMGIVRHTVLNMLRKAKEKLKDISLKGLRKKAGWDEDTLTSILQQHF